jgi:hypothetical protein
MFIFSDTAVIQNLPVNTLYFVDLTQPTNLPDVRLGGTKYVKLLPHLMPPSCPELIAETSC